MNPYIISTDNNADLPASYYQEHGIPVVYLSYTIGDENYDNVTKKQTIDEFYAAIRGGAMPVTQQVNPENSKALFVPYAEQGLDILHIAFSSGLSGTYQSNCIAAVEVREEYPNCNLVVVDSLCASMGQGFLVAQAVKRKEAGMPMHELVAWIESAKLNIAHEVLADDLFHLQRGGRVSKAAAVFGSALGVKPMIHVDDNGKLVPFAKQRGRSAGMKMLVSNLVKKMDKTQGETVFISHSDCVADAETLAEMIREQAGVTDIVISDIGPTIGAHTGVGTLAVFYFAQSRAV